MSYLTKEDRAIYLRTIGQTPVVSHQDSKAFYCALWPLVGNASIARMMACRINGSLEEARQDPEAVY